MWILYILVSGVESHSSPQVRRYKGTTKVVNNNDFSVAGLLHYCCELRFSSKLRAKIVKKSFFKTSEILISKSVSTLFFWNSRYTLERSMHSLRANHVMVRS